MPAAEELFNPIINLAKARELLLLDAEHCMKQAPDVVAQRQKMVSGIEQLIGESVFKVRQEDPVSFWR